MNKRPFIYLGVAVLIAVVIILFENPLGNRIDDSSLDYFIPEFNVDNIGGFEVSQHIEGTKVKRKDKEDWEVTDKITKLKTDILKKEKREAQKEEWKDADRTRILSALGSFSTLSKGIIVSKNPERRNQYQVGPMGVNVIIFDNDGKSIVDLIIGKSGPDFSSTYVRSKDSDDVHLVDKNLTGIFSPNASDWLKKEVKEEAQEPKEEKKK